MQDHRCQRGRREKREFIDESEENGVDVWVCRKECVCVHMWSEIIVSPTPVKGRYGL